MKKTLCGPKVCLEVLEKGKNFPLPEPNTRSSNPYLSHYTDWRNCPPSCRHLSSCFIVREQVLMCRPEILHALSCTFSTEVYGSLDRSQHNADNRTGGIPLHSYTTAALLLSAGYQRMVFVGPHTRESTTAIYRRRKQTKIVKCHPVVLLYYRNYIKVCVNTNNILYSKTCFDKSQLILRLTVGLLKSIVEQMHNRSVHKFT